jgi:hypothetical protein
VRSLAAALVAAAPFARAEEGGSGHYQPGATASFIDALPGRPGLSLANALVFDPAHSSAQLPSGGLLTASLDARTWTDSFSGIYQTPWELLGGKCAFGAVVSAVWLETTATVVDATGTHPVTDAGSGLGDLLLYPFMLGWTSPGGALKSDFRFGIYAPIGRYEGSSLASQGKNFWTFEPGVLVSYLSGAPGVEASGFVAVDVNTSNTVTDYQSGAVFHVDATVAGHVPLFDGRAGFGASGFYYQQITADSGSGAKLGSFEGRTLGVGPVASFAIKVFGADAAVEIKWLPELSVENRLKGNYFWLKARATF